MIAHLENTFGRGKKPRDMSLDDIASATRCRRNTVRLILRKMTSLNVIELTENGRGKPMTIALRPKDGRLPLIRKRNSP